MSSEVALPDNPYVGPRPFGQNDANLFFGREEETADVVSLIAAHPLLLLYAESGAGKTSLINAGVIPKLEEERFEVLPVIRFSAVLRERDPIAKDANIFVQAAVRGILSPLPEDARNFDGLSIRESLMQTRVHSGELRSRVLIIDQFEEIFTSKKQRWRDRDEFFRQISAAVETDDDLHVLLGIREDFLAHLDPYTHLLPARCRVRFRLERLREKAALVAIRAPLSDTGVEFAPGVAEGMVRNLLTAEIPNTSDQATPNALNPEINTYIEEFVEPVQLQLACFNCYRNLPNGAVLITAAVAEAFGNVDRALADFYEEVLREVIGVAGDTVTEATLRLWFERLITEDESRGLVFRGDTQTGTMSNEVVDRLDALHIIRVELRGDKRWYELSHDRFVRPILKSNEDWRRRRDKKAWRRLTVSCVFALTLLGFVVVKWYRSHEEQKRTVIKISEDKAKLAILQDELASNQKKLLETKLSLQLLQENATQYKVRLDALADEDSRIHSEIEKHRRVLGRTPMGRQILAEIDHSPASPSASQVPTLAAPAEATESTLPSRAAIPLQDAATLVARQIVQGQAKAQAVEEKISLLNHLAETATRGTPPATPASTPLDAHLTVYVGRAVVPNRKRPGEIVPEVYIDGVPYAFVVPFTSFSVNLSAGQHRVCVADAYSPCDDPYAVGVSLRSNTTLYLKVMTDPRGVNYVPTTTAADEVDREHTAVYPQGNRMNFI